jgi:two-component system, NtrC family, sensor histidine kinase HydH
VEQSTKAKENARALARKLRSAPDLNRTLAELADGLTALLEVSGTTVLLVDKEREHLHGRIGRPDAAFPMWTKVRIGLDDASTASVRALKDKAPQVVTDTAKDPRAKPWLVRQYAAKSLVAVPMWAGDDPVGAIVMVETRRVRRFEPFEVELAQWVADEAAGLIAAYDR